MYYALLEPSLLSISEEDWHCEHSRDEYLEHFNIIMESINSSEVVKLAWNDIYDELFWTSPQKLPWRMDKFWSNTIIPVIYEKLQKNSEHYELSNNTCSIEPQIKYNRDDLHAVFCRLLPQLHFEEKNVIVCFGPKNIPIKEHIFIISGNAIEPNPKLFYSANCFLSLIRIESDLWPKNGVSNDDNHIIMKKAIETKISRDLGNENILYDFSFSKPFLKKLTDVKNDREKILTSMARRLIMNTGDAGRDGCLQDEGISGKENIRRLRVTPRPSSKRIHYKKNSNKIEFQMFYDAGEHDDGL